MTARPVTVAASAHTLHDAAAAACTLGPGSRISLGSSLIVTQPGLPAASLPAADRLHVAFGTQSTPPDLPGLAPLLEAALAAAGTGFLAACFAAPAQGRTVYQGHLFQRGRLITNLQATLRDLLDARIAVIPHEIVATGHLRRALVRAREQGAALALIDALDETPDITDALRSQVVTAGPAWLLGDAPSGPQETHAPGRLAILSGALDRDTLFQLGAVPSHQIDFSAPDPAGAALAWAASQPDSVIIAASAPPDRVTAGAPATTILADIAAGLAATGIRNFVITGNDTAAAILHRLGIETLTFDGQEAGLPWLSGGGYSFLLKPAGFGPRDLFITLCQPQIRLIAAVE
jgi:uncharacterized protein YgbK (DUF1537 family)